MTSLLTKHGWTSTDGVRYTKTGTKATVLQVDSLYYWMHPLFPGAVKSFDLDEKTLTNLATMFEHIPLDGGFRGTRQATIEAAGPVYLTPNLWAGKWHGNNGYSGYSICDAVVKEHQALYKRILEDLRQCQIMVSSLRVDLEELILTNPDLPDKWGWSFLEQAEEYARGKARLNWQSDHFEFQHPDLFGGKVVKAPWSEFAKFCFLADFEVPDFAEYEDPSTT